MTAKHLGRYKPGHKVPLSGQIQEIGATTEKTVIRGKIFPPTSAPGKTYVYVDVTRHKASRLAGISRLASPAEGPAQAGLSPLPA